jgi:hypothetical protein
VERAGDLVALHGALGEVPAHVPAVRVEHVDGAVTALEDDELLAEGEDRVRLAVGEVLDQSDAVPPAGEPRRRGPGLDAADLVLDSSHVPTIPSGARTRRLGVRVPRLGAT